MHRSFRFSDSIELGVQRPVIGVHGPASEKNFRVHRTHFPDWHAAGNTEHWLQNGREQGTLALKAPGTGNIGPKSAGNREHCMKNNGGITHPSMKEKYMRYYAKFGCLQFETTI